MSKTIPLGANSSDIFLSNRPASVGTESEHPKGYKTSRGSHAGLFLFIAIFFFIPSCELKPAFTKEVFMSDLTKKFEGYSSTIYKDTQGKRTIGYGFNLENPRIKMLLRPEVQKGLYPLKIDEANKVFDFLYGNAVNDAIKFVGEDTYNKLSPELQTSLNDISYNLGYPRLSKFREFKRALNKLDYPKAAEELKKSKWFYQVGDRAKYHYNIFKGAKNE
jgi:lysozyme